MRQRAFAWLAERAHQGAWQHTPFIVMHVGRVGAQRGPILSYASQTIAAAYALKAASMALI
jgi:hypothetical protein